MKEIFKKGQKKRFALQGFGDTTFKVNKSITGKISQLASQKTYVGEHSQDIMKKDKRKGARYIEPVEWVSTQKEKLLDNWLSELKLFWNSFVETATNQPDKLQRSSRRMKNSFQQNQVFTNK